MKRAHKALGSRIKNVALALPAAAVITKKVILPGNQREEDMEVQVQGEANQYIPFSLDEVNLDFQVLGPAPSGEDEVEVLIAASRKEKIEDRVAAAEAAGLQDHRDGRGVLRLADRFRADLRRQFRHFRE